MDDHEPRPPPMRLSDCGTDRDKVELALSFLIEVAHPSTFVGAAILALRNELSPRGALEKVSNGSAQDRD